MARIRPKPPTMAEQIEALKAEIEQLNAEKKDLLDRVRTAEQNVYESRPYRLLERKNEELTADIERYLAEIQTLRDDKKHILSELWAAQANQKQEKDKPKPKRGRPPKVTDDVRNAVMRLHKSGESVRAIARHVDISVGSVSAILNGKG